MPTVMSTNGPDGQPYAVGVYKRASEAAHDLTRRILWCQTRGELAQWRDSTGKFEIVHPRTGTVQHYLWIED